MSLSKEPTVCFLCKSESFLRILKPAGCDRCFQQIADGAVVNFQFFLLNGIFLL